MDAQLCGWHFSLNFLPLERAVRLPFAPADIPAVVKGLAVLALILPGLCHPYCWHLPTSLCEHILDSQGLAQGLECQASPPCHPPGRSWICVGSKAAVLPIVWLMGEARSGFPTQ